MSEKRRGLGRGLGALIPTSLDGARSTRERPVDVFFPDSRPDGAPDPSTAAVATLAAERSDGVGAGTATADLAAAAERDVALTQTAAADPALAGDAGEAVGDTVGGTSTDEPSTVVSDTNTADASAVATATEERHEPEATPAGVAVRSSGLNGLSHSSPDVTASEPLGSDEELMGTTPDAAAAAIALEGLHGSLTTVPEPRTSGEPTVDDGGLLPVPGAVFAELPLDEIRPNPRQPRTVFDEDALDELVGSIREIGVLQPVVVRRAGDSYELIMGERRWRAAGAAGLDTIPAIIRETGDEDLLRDALLENLHRSQLNPLEEAAAYQQLLDDFGCTHDELASRLHRSRPQISNTLRLLKLPPLVQRRVAAGVLSAGHARALLGLADGGAIERLAQRIVAEGLSVRAVEEIVALGGDGLVAKRRAVPRAGVRNEALDALAGRLSDRFETRVKVALGKSRGRLTVEFASVQDLNRILNTLAPEDPGLFHG